MIRRGSTARAIQKENIPRLLFGLSRVYIVKTAKLSAMFAYFMPCIQRMKLGCGRCVIS